MKPAYRYLFAALLLVFSNASYSSDAANIVSYTQASFSNTDNTQTVTLPHLWEHKKTTQVINTGRYEIPIDIPQRKDNTVYSILIPKMVMTARISLNGINLFEPNSVQEPISRHWNTPILLYIPQSAVQNTNILELEMYSYPGYGMLSPIYIGPHKQLEAIYNKRYFLQKTLNVYLYTASLAVAVFSFLVALNHRDQKGYFYFSAAAFFWSFYNLNFFTTEIAISGKLWWWWVHSCIDWWAVMVVMFSHRFVGLKYPKFEQAIISYGIGVSAIYFVADLSIFEQVVNTFHLVSMLLIVYVAAKQLWLWHTQANKDSLLLACGISILIVFGLNDIYLNSPLALDLIESDYQSWLWRFNLAPLGEPIVWALILWRIITRYAHLNNEIQDLQKNLEDKIHSTTAAYEKEAMAAQQLHLAKTAAKERQSIYSDLYNDLAEKLSAIYHTAQTPQQADAAKAAIAELRDTAQISQKTNQQIGDILADIKLELIERCEASNIHAEWETIMQPPAITLNGTTGPMISRVIREAISNIIKHADASKVSVSVYYQQNTLNISLHDNGKGIAADNTEGRGIGNMRRRINEIKGDFSITGQPGKGTTINLKVPCL